MFVKKRIPIKVSIIFLFALILGIFTEALSVITTLLSPLTEIHIWYQETSLPVLLILLGVFLAVMVFIIVLVVFVPMGQYLGECFSSSKNVLVTYSVNIVFSLLGIWAFSLLSFKNVSPYIGLIVVIVILFGLASRKERKVGFAFFTLTIALVILNIILSKNTLWSPYQKLTLFNYQKEGMSQRGYLLNVNNVGYMLLLNLSTTYRDGVFASYSNTELKNKIQFMDHYTFPYFFKPAAGDVLVIGAGGGNDIAAAVRNDTSQIDAVEIDPAIVQLGKKYHPEKPYQSNKVTTYVEDGRAFLKNANKKYDLIVFGLADSHTLTSSLANVQLDNYLYTLEGLQEAKDALKPDGMLFLSFAVNRPWIGSKIKTNLADVFAAEPLVVNIWSPDSVLGWGGTVFVSENKKGMIEKTLGENVELKNYVEENKTMYEPFVSTQLFNDNWPYLYLVNPRIPLIHIILSAVLVCALLLIFKKVELTQRLKWESFFMGAGFMLYEFQNISKSALLFGNTWLTNSYIISAILLLILLANIVYKITKVPLRVSAVLLLAAFIIQLMLPVSFYNSFSGAAKYLLVPVLLNLPLFFSSLIFITLFSKSEEKQTFFASNLIGSSVGGFLSFISFLTGFSSIVFISLVMYVFGLLFVRSRV